MGLLDDAIREHLELKRRSGADVTQTPDEPREAPPTEREPDPTGPPEGQRYAPFGAGLDLDDGEADDYTEETHYSPPPPPAPAVSPFQAAAPMPMPTLPPPVEAPQPGPATEEYRVPVAEPDRADVLEQTPDFLQETPEHDRLWFEQAPPQEFDFDK